MSITLLSFVISIWDLLGPGWGRFTSYHLEPLGLLNPNGPPNWLTGWILGSCIHPLLCVRPSSSPSRPGPEGTAADLTGNSPPTSAEPPTLAFWTQTATPPVMRVPQATAGVTVRGEASVGRVGSLHEGLPPEVGWAQLSCSGGRRSPRLCLTQAPGDSQRRPPPREPERFTWHLRLSEI